MLLATVYPQLASSFELPSRLSTASYPVDFSVIEVLWPDLSIFSHHKEGQALRPDFADRLCER
jgi:hypothetical protein